MKKTPFILVLFLNFSIMVAQQSSVKIAFLEKWENSKDYLIAIAEVMPEQEYDFKPTERQMSFKEQLIHIKENMEWLSTTYFDNNSTEISTIENEKERIISNLTTGFNSVLKAIKETPEEDLKTTVEFFAGTKSKLQILNLLQDHVTHHRGQLIVYLNLKNITPPKYIGW